MSTKEIVVVDACGGVYGHAHGSIHIYEVDADEFESRSLPSLPVDETFAELQDMEQKGFVTEKQSFSPDDVITV